MLEKGNKIKDLIFRASEDAKPILEQIGLSPEAFARVAFNAVLSNPKILDCEPQSLRRAVLECAQRGLLPDGDSAAIIPRKGKATFQVGYKGMCDLARRAIPGVSIRANVVTDKDTWVYKDGLNLVIEHERDPATRPTEQNVIAAYAIAEMPGGGKEAVVMMRCDIDHIRSTYAHSSSEAWAKEWAEQAKKTAVRRLGKMLPIRSGLLTKSDPIVPLGDPFDEQVIDVEPEAGAPDPAAQPARTRGAARPRPAPAPAPAAPAPAPAPAPEPLPEPEPEDEQRGFPDAGF